MVACVESISSYYLRVYFVVVLEGLALFNYVPGAQSRDVVVDAAAGWWLSVGDVAADMIGIGSNRCRRVGPMRVVSVVGSV